MIKHSSKSQACVSAGGGCGSGNWELLYLLLFADDGVVEAQQGRVYTHAASDEQCCCSYGLHINASKTMRLSIAVKECNKRHVPTQHGPKVLISEVVREGNPKVQVLGKCAYD